jgi:adenylate cyclase
MASDVRELLGGTGSQMPLQIEVSNTANRQRIEHEIGPLEFGRGPQRQTKRCLIDGDLTVSRDQLRVERLSDSRMRVENLSQRIPVVLPGRGQIPQLQTQEVDLPVVMVVGQTTISIQADAIVNPLAEAIGNLKTIDSWKLAEKLAGGEVRLASLPSDRAEKISAAAHLGEWLQRIIELQQTGAGSAEFYNKTAQALIDLVGLDLALVLLERDGKWSIAGSAVSADHVSVQYSRTLVSHVASQRRTFYEDLDRLGSNASSLADIQCGVASPIFGLQEDVVGVLYGVRTQFGLVARGSIEPPEAQLVQLLAAAVGANLARSLAQQTRAQFEQFFSADLVRELQRDSKLLEGRTETVTILASDLRGFTSLSERLGPHKTCRMLGDMMDRLTARIHEQGGVIVDYAGDGILAMWNAPIKQPDHAARACRAALAMLGELPGLNARWSDNVAAALALGIGINTGEALVGNTGSQRKFKYGPHGHTVNLASRVENATKQLRLPLLITAATREQLPDTFLTRRLGQVVLPGVRRPVVTYEVYAEHASPEWIRLRDAYEAALSLFESGQWARACQALTPLLDTGEGAAYDWPTLKLMRRAWECMETRPDVFEPIIEVGSK